ncbi:MAG: M1 family metallopeptidase [Candidatus Zixiibacteriota bacterium]
MVPQSRRTLTINIATAFVAFGLMAGPSPTIADERLERNVVPVEQAIALKIDADQSDYSGSVRIVLDVKEQTSSFQFHSEGLTFQGFNLSRGGESRDVTYETAEKVVTVTSDTPLEPGRYELAIEFTNAFDTQAVSLYRMETEGNSYCFSQMEDVEAREAFPCWDEPFFKIPYQMTLTVPEVHMAVSNMPIESETVSEGWKTDVFKKSPPMPSYLLAIATGPLETVEISGMSVPGRVITTKGRAHLTREAVESTPPILAALEKYFDSPYPFEKLDFIAVPEFWPGAMENPGAVTYAEGILLLDPASVSVGQRRRLASTTAHELAHMWFGDLVTMEWWDDLWLNESFATWMGNKIAQQVYPTYGIETSGAQAMQGTLSSDARPSAMAIRRPIESTDKLLENIGPVYQKGRAVLRMFEQWITEDDFRTGVLSYLEAHQWSTATADDLWAALSASTDKEIGPALSGFLDQPGVPLVTLEPVGNGRIRLTQKRIHNYGKPEMEFTPWHIPVTLKIATATSATTKTVVLSKLSQEFEISSDGSPIWIMPHTDATGYYRWAVPPKMMLEMAEQATERLTPRERVGFIGNLSALLDIGSIRGDTYLGVIAGFSDDPEPAVISAMLSALGKVENAFVPDDMKNSFAGYVRRVLSPALDRIGLEKKNGENDDVSLVRPRLVAWMAETGKDKQVMAFAAHQAKMYMEDATSVDPSLASICLQLACIEGDREMYDECKVRFEAAQNPTERSRYLRVLGAFRDSSLVADALEYIFSGPLRPQEVFSIPGGIARASDEQTDMIFHWMTEHYDEITGRIPPPFAAFLPFFASGCSAQRLALAKEFFAMPEHNKPGTEARLAKVIDQVTDCASLREREGETVAAYLSRVATE